MGSLTPFEKAIEKKLYELRREIAEYEKISQRLIMSSNDIDNLIINQTNAENEINKLVKEKQILQNHKPKLFEIFQIQNKVENSERFLPSLDENSYSSIIEEETVANGLHVSFDYAPEDYEPKKYNFQSIKTQDIDITKETFKSIFLKPSSSLFFLQILFLLIKDRKLLRNLSEGRKFTLQQKLAILSNEDRNQVIAGAGTGKTALTVGKAEYLFKKGFKPSEILILTFGKDASKEIRERMTKVFKNKDTEQIENFDIQTFHAYGNGVLKSIDEKRIDSKEDDPDNTSAKKFIYDLFNGLHSENPISKKVVKYFSDYLYPSPPSEEKIRSLSEYKNYIQLLPRTLKGDVVKSYSELRIANFLYSKGIEYEYEKEWKNKEDLGFIYQPDFTLINNDNEEIILEFFGIDKEGNVKPGIAPEAYKQQMLEKRRLHQESGSDLFELNYQDVLDDKLLESLEKGLVKRGFSFNERSADEMLKRFNENKYYDRFAQLCHPILNQFRSNGETIEDLRNRSNGDNRTEAFIDIFEWLYKQYSYYLFKEGSIGFSEQINDAVELINENTYKPNQYKWIIVDEFQDISTARFRLLQAILNKTDAKLMVVGDDWQSIYRFTGSNISFVKNFGDYFGRVENRKLSSPVRLKLTKSFRFNNKIKDFSNEFIRSKKIQVDKKVTVTKNNFVKDNRIWIHWRQYNTTRVDKVKEIVQLLSSKNLKGELYILSRYRSIKDHMPDSAEIQEIKNLWGKEKTKKDSEKELRVDSIHTSKGREGDFVIISDLDSGMFGFPPGRFEDPLMELVMPYISDIEKIEFGEERRTLYVALTRAKNQIHLIVDEANPSIFIKEILSSKKLNSLVEVYGKNANPINCEVCKDGNLYRWTNNQNNNRNYKCTNFPLCPTQFAACRLCNDILDRKSDKEWMCRNKKCEGTANRCMRCRDGYLNFRIPYHFWGCIHYNAKTLKGKCKNTVDYLELDNEICFNCNVGEIHGEYINNKIKTWYCTNCDWKEAGKNT